MTDNAVAVVTRTASGAHQAALSANTALDSARLRQAFDHDGRGLDAFERVAPTSTPARSAAAFAVASSFSTPITVQPASEQTPQPVLDRTTRDCHRFQPCPQSGKTGLGDNVDGCGTRPLDDADIAAVVAMVNQCRSADSGG